MDCHVMRKNERHVIQSNLSIMISPVKGSLWRVIRGETSHVSWYVTWHGIRIGVQAKVKRDVLDVVHRKSLEQ